MKRFNSLFAVVMLAMSMVVVSSAITSCSKDDDNPPANNPTNPTNPTDGVVGTWSGSDKENEVHFSLTFKADGTGIWVERYGSSATFTDNFSYVMKDKSSGLMYIEDDDEPYHISINGKQMYIDYERYYLIAQKE